MLRDDAVVVEVGGWANPFERADWVVDLMPYETRDLYERKGWIEPRGRRTERFGPHTWIERDICSREPFPFDDDSVDFVVCSHTLEDVRDPIWVCDEIARIALAGYIEVPSRLEEQSLGVEGPFAGWAHHRWLIDVAADDIVFTLKPHNLHSLANCHFPEGFWHTLDDVDRVETLWWEGDFGRSERIFIEEAAVDRYVPDFVTRTLEKRPYTPRHPSAARRLARRLARR